MVPLVAYNGGFLYDDWDEDYGNGGLIVTGLLPGESYTVETTYRYTTDKAVLITFYQDEACTVPGFLSSGGSRTVTVRLRTKTNRTWLDVYPDLNDTTSRTYHRNRAQLYTNGSSITANATVYPHDVRPLKTGTYFGQVELDGETYPVYQYRVDFQGIKDILDATTATEPRPNASGHLVPRKYFDAIESFDTSVFRYLDVNDAADYAILQAAGVNMSTVERLQRLGNTNSGSLGTPAIWTQTATGGTLRFYDWEQIPHASSQSGDHLFYYYLIVRDEQALEALRSRATSSDYAVSLTNTVAYAHNGASDSATVQFTYRPITKEMEDYDPATRSATFRIVANAARETLNGGSPMTMTDEYSERLSVDYSTITVETDPAENADQVSWNYSGNAGTFTVPDATKVVLSYRAVIHGEDNENVEISNTATLAGFYAKVEESVKLTAEGSGSASNPRVRVFKYETGNMNRKLEGAVFQLYKATEWNAENGRVTAGEPMTFHTTGTSAASYAKTDSGYSHTHAAGDFIYFITDSTGYAQVQLFQNTDGLTLETGVRYYLKEAEAPEDYLLSDIIWSFQIETLPDYSHLIYYNNDIMTVANEPDSEVEVVVQGKKILRGRDMAAGEFTFTLTPVDADGNPIGAPLTAASAEGSAFEETSFSFDPIAYDFAAYEAAEYRDDSGNALFYYLAEETVPEGATDNVKDGVVYSTDRYLVVVTVSYADGKLDASWKAYPDEG